MSFLQRDFCAKIASLKLHSAITSFLKLRDVIVSTTFPANSYPRLRTTKTANSRRVPTPLLRRRAAIRFELCVNRVENGFFSNHLADLPDLPVGATIQIHGPHGHFVLQEPITDSILVATGTGVAPMRAFTEWLFPVDGPDRSHGKDIWLVYGTRHETDIYYQDEFEALAKRMPNFHYLPTLSRALDVGPACAATCRSTLQDRRRARETAGATVAWCRLSIPRWQRPLMFDIYCYICGLNFMVSGVRELLDGYGWHKKQIVFERYD